MGTDRLGLFNRKLAGKLLSQNLKADEIYGFCFLRAEIYLDYYGCNAHLNFDRSDIISSREIFPGDKDGEVFFLLQPHHVDKILKSLQEHFNQLTVMSEREINKVINFRNFCADNEGFMVAYLLDF